VAGFGKPGIFDHYNTPGGFALSCYTGRAPLAGAEQIAPAHLAVIDIVQPI